MAAIASVGKGLVKKEEPRVNGVTTSTGQMSRAQNPDWTAEEVKAVDSALMKFPSDRYPLLERSIRISATLRNKTARDVALRLKWLQRRDLAKKAKKEAADRNAKSVRRAGSGSIFAIQATTPASTAASPSATNAPNMEGAIDGGPGGQVAQLLDQNFHIIGQIRENMKWFKVNENTDLLVRMRDNTINILNNMSQSEGVMSQMPPLPVRLSLELANGFLPKVVGAAPQLQPQQHLMLRMGQIPMQHGQLTMQTLPQLCMPQFQTLQGQPGGMPMQLQVGAGAQMRMVAVSSAASGVPTAIQMPAGMQMTAQSMSMSMPMSMPMQL